MYKMLVLDMDGTLLNSQHQISERNKAAIKKAKEQGIHIMLASGRAYGGLQSYVKEMGLNEEGAYTVAGSGAVVHDNSNHNIVYENVISPQSLMEMQLLAEEWDLDLCGYSKNGFLYHKDNLYTRLDVIANNTEAIQVDFSNNDKEYHVHKMCLVNESMESRDELLGFFYPHQAEDIIIRNKKNFIPDLLYRRDWITPSLREKHSVAMAMPFTLEFLDIKSNKAVGVKYVADKLGISMSEIIAMGDSGNDVEMLREVGLGVAMANASDEAIEASDQVTASNDQDGVAQVIEEYLFK